MNATLGHFLLNVIGLLSTALIAISARSIWRRHPSIAYRVLALLLAATLVLPLLQLGAQGRAAGFAPSGWEAFWNRNSAPPVVSEESCTDVVELSDAESAFELAAAAPSLSTSDAPTSTVNLPDLRWVLVLYGLGLAILLVRMGGRWRATLRLLQQAAPVENPVLLQLFDRVAKNSPLRDQIRLLTAPAILAPSCIGFGRPAILLPNIPMSRSDEATLECALLHELIHLERKDSRVALLQEILTAVFWFHPAAWWLSNEVDLFRELSCDEEVIRRKGGRRRYAHALLEHAERCLQSATQRIATCPSLIPWFKKRSQLQRRIEMLVKNQKPPTQPVRVLVLAAAFVSVFALWSSQITLAATLLPFPGAQVPEQEPVETVPVEEVEALEEILEAEEESSEGRHLLEQLMTARVHAAQLDHVQYQQARLSALAELQTRQNSTETELADHHARLEQALRHTSANAEVKLGLTLTETENSDQPELIVQTVEANGPAATAGVQVGDIITHIDGDTPASLANLRAKKATKKPGDQMRLHLRRGEAELDVVVTFPKAHVAVSPTGVGTSEADRLRSEIHVLQAALAELRAKEAQLNAELSEADSRLTNAPRAAELRERVTSGARDTARRAATERARVAALDRSKAATARTRERAQATQRAAAEARKDAASSRSNRTRSTGSGTSSGSNRVTNSRRPPSATAAAETKTAGAEAGAMQDHLKAKQGEQSDEYRRFHEEMNRARQEFEREQAEARRRFDEEMQRARQEFERSRYEFDSKMRGEYRRLEQEVEDVRRKSSEELRRAREAQRRSDSHDEYKRYEDDRIKDDPLGNATPGYFDSAAPPVPSAPTHPAVPTAPVSAPAPPTPSFPTTPSPSRN